MTRPRRQRQKANGIKVNDLAIWLDDQWDPAPGYTIWCKTAHEAVSFLARGGVVKISLDHDLGLACGTGIHVLEWMIHQARAGKLARLQVLVHTGSPTREREMLAMVAELEDIWKGKI